MEPMLGATSGPPGCSVHPSLCQTTAPCSVALHSTGSNPEPNPRPPGSKWFDSYLPLCPHTTPPSYSTPVSSNTLSLGTLIFERQAPSYHLLSSKAISLERLSLAIQSSTSFSYLSYSGHLLQPDIVSTVQHPTLAWEPLTSGTSSSCSWLCPQHPEECLTWVGWGGVCYILDQVAREASEETASDPEPE